MEIGDVFKIQRVILFRNNFIVYLLKKDDNCKMTSKLWTNLNIFSVILLNVDVKLIILSIYFQNYENYDKISAILLIFNVKMTIFWKHL